REACFGTKHPHDLRNRTGGLESAFPNPRNPRNPRLIKPRRMDSTEDSFFPQQNRFWYKQNRFWCEMFQHSARCLNIPHQIDFSCRKIVFPTAKSVLEFQNFFCHRMLKDFTTNRFFLQKNRFSYNKIRFGIAKCFFSQNVERFHNKSIFPVPTSFLV